MCMLFCRPYFEWLSSTTVYFLFLLLQIDDRALIRVEICVFCSLALPGNPLLQIYFSVIQVMYLLKDKANSADPLSPLGVEIPESLEIIAGLSEHTEVVFYIRLLEGQIHSDISIWSLWLKFKGLFQGSPRKFVLNRHYWGLNRLWQGGQSQVLYTWKVFNITHYALHRSGVNTILLEIRET